LWFQVNADPWFSLPVAVDDNDAYANSMARYVAANLSPERSVYIEFGQGGPGWMSTDLVSWLVHYNNTSTLYGGTSG
jgi:hypothetical protein